jgi:hypothetical protein
MKDLNIVDRLDECREYGFDDLVVAFNGIIWSIMETGVPLYQVKAEFIHWCYHVDFKVDKHRKELEALNQLTADNILSKSGEVFGTEA